MVCPEHGGRQSSLAELREQSCLDADAEMKKRQEAPALPAGVLHVKSRMRGEKTWGDIQRGYKQLGPGDDGDRPTGVG